jgi:cytoskeletal protein CcmA (bactofilin family)
MGATYTRQSSYTDGDVITAAHTNDEFDQLLAAFQASSGHTHDGTANEGGPITKLLGNTLTFGAGTAGTDITITFDGETSDGVLKWMEDEDYFEFSDDILVASTEKLQFRDTAIYINSSTDGQLDLVADTEIQIAATTVDINGNVDISGTLTVGGALDFSEANISNVGSLGLDSIFGDADTNTSITFSGSDVITIAAGGDNQVTFTNGGIVPSTNNDIDLGSSSVQFKDAFFDGTVTTDAIVVASTIGHDDDTDLLTLADGIVTVAGEISTTTLDIGGTNVTATATELNVMDGDTSASSTTVADADRVVFNDAGTMKQVAVTDLAAYFDDEITAMPNLTSVGTLTTLTVDNVIINGTTIGHTSDTDLITLADGIATVAGEVSVTTLDIGGTNVTSTAAELNIVDGGTSATSTTLADADRVVVNDNGTMVQVALTDFETYFESALDTLSNVTTIGTLDSGAISSGFGNIDIGSSTANFGATTVDSLSASDGNITNVGDIALDSISADGTDINVAISDNSGTAFTIKQGSDAYFIVDTGNSSESISIGTGISGTAITLGHSTSEVTVADNLTVTGDLTVSGTTTTVNSTTVNLNDHNIVLDSGNSTSAVINGAGITIEGGSGDDATFTYNTTGPQFELKLGSSFEDLQTAKLTATELDISGDADIDGTLEADAITVNGTALNTVIAGVTVTDATNSAHVLVTDNESTDEDNLITFVENGTSSTGNVGLEMDGDLTYNPSTGRLTATQLAGTLQTAAQANVTSLGTLTTLTVDNVIINGSTIGHTSDTDLMTVASGVLTVAGEVDATSLDISGDADIDGTLEADAITVNGTALNTVIADEATALAIALG